MVRLLFSKLHCFPYVPIIIHVQNTAALVWFCTWTHIYLTFKRVTSGCFLQSSIYLCSWLSEWRMGSSKPFEKCGIWVPVKWWQPQESLFCSFCMGKRMLCRQHLVTQEHSKRCISPQWLIFYFTLLQLVFSRMHISLKFGIHLLLKKYTASNPPPPVSPFLINSGNLCCNFKSKFYYRHSNLEEES